jgi:hypothetical protein
VPLPLLARSATPFFAAGISGFETIGDRALAGAAPVSTCARPHPLRARSTEKRKKVGLFKRFFHPSLSTFPAFLTFPPFANFYM